MKSTLAVFILLILSFGVNAQNKKIQELKKELQNHSIDDSVKVTLLHNLAKAYKYTNPDSAEYYVGKCLSLSKKLNNNQAYASANVLLSILKFRKGDVTAAIALCEESRELFAATNNTIGEADANNNLGNIYHESEQLDKALPYYLKALELAQKAEHKSAIGDYYNNLGNYYRNKGDYRLCLEYMFNALHIREELNDSLGLEISLGNLSGIYYDLKKFDEAEKFSKRAYQIQKAIGDKEGLIQTTITPGGVYSEKHEYVKSIELFEEATSVAKELNHSDGVAIGLSNLADIYIRVNQPKKAEEMFRTALEICEKNKDLRGISVNEIGIGHSLNMKHRYAEAIPHLEKGYKLALQINNLLSKLDAAEQLAISYEKVNKPNLSIFYHKAYKNLKAQLFNEETSNKAQQIEFDYLLEKKQNEISLLEKEKSLQEAKSNFNELLIISLLSLVVALIIIAALINKNRVKATKAKELILNQKAEIVNQTKNLEELNLFKDKTFSILSHDLRTPISNLNGVLQLMDVEYLSEDEFKSMIGKLKEQFKSIHILVENTLNWARTQMHGELEPVKELVQISEIVNRNFLLFKENSDQKDIITRYTETESLKTYLDPNHLDIILRNLILNAIKFTNEHGVVQVHSYKDKDRIYIEVKDNGRGMSKEKVEALFKYDKQSVSYGTAGEKGAGIGLILTHEILLRNNGTLQITSEENKGSTFSISFPL
ncbi:MAG: tetratricopeptide repeat-containing sensor histidine kinase [Bacteroidia bacterium]|nr:tetratricopeptide repeat-containing sensor histidine kinase [Bacteroidia bacterium]